MTILAFGVSAVVMTVVLALLYGTAAALGGLIGFLFYAAADAYRALREQDEVDALEARIARLEAVLEAT